MFFLELFLEIMKDKDVDTIDKLHKEANELLAITVSSINTAKRNQKK